MQGTRRRGKWSFCLIHAEFQFYKLRRVCGGGGVDDGDGFTTGECIEYHWPVCWLVTQSCPTLCNPVDCGPPGSAVHGILQARILEWVASSLSRISSWPRNRTRVSIIAGRFFTIWATREALHLYLYWTVYLIVEMVIFMCTLPP